MRDEDIPLRPLVDGPVSAVAVHGEVVIELGTLMTVLTPAAALDAARQLVAAAAEAEAEAEAEGQ